MLFRYNICRKAFVTDNTTSAVYKTRLYVRKNGYAFQGWGVSSERSKKGTIVKLAANEEIDHQTKYGDITGCESWGVAGNGIRDFWPIYAPTTYTVTLNTAGGSLANSGWTTVTADSVYKKTYNIETNTFAVPNPIRSGYIFTGWKLNNAGTASTSVQIAKGSTGDKSYTATWEKSTTLTFAAQIGGTVNPSGAQENVGTVTGSKSSTATANAGYTFVGWYDGDTQIKATTGSVYVGGDKGRTLTVKGSATAPLAAKTYTAHFSENKTVLTFSADTGGTVSPSGAQTDIGVVTGSKSSTARAKTGYTFAGWYDGETKIDETDSTKNVYVGNVGNATDYRTLYVRGSASSQLTAKTYTAKFTAVEYTVTLDLQGGSSDTGFTEIK